jgi:hypothetical protein
MTLNKPQPPPFSTTPTTFSGVQAYSAHYYGGRAPSHKNPDWLMQQKTTKKKGRPLKFLFHRSKLQAGSFNDVTCPRP